MVYGRIFAVFSFSFAFCLLSFEFNSMPLHHWRYDKILTIERAKKVADQLRQDGKKIVTVNGAFDILHAGHLDMLEESREQGDVLFVGLNSDASVKEGKGDTRPYIPELERAAMLAALACVDYVIIVDAPYNEVHNVLIRSVKPHIHANGEEYGQPEEWVDWPAMQEVGAKGHVVARREGLATSMIIERISKDLTSLQ